MTQDDPYWLRFRKFRSLWKTDDPAWVAQRKREWSAVADSGQMMFSGAQMPQMRQLLPQFYVYGVDAPIYGKNRYLLTPFETAEQAQELFYTFRDAQEQYDIFSSSMKASCWAYPKSPVARQRVRVIRDALLGTEYQPIHVPDQGRTEPREITSRRDWVCGFIFGCEQFLNNRFEFDDLDYYYPVDCIRYFISMLRYMEAHQEQTVEAVYESDYLSELAALVTSDQKLAKLSGIRLELAEKLRAEFIAPDAPIYLRVPDRMPEFG